MLILTGGAGSYGDSSEQESSSSSEDEVSIGRRKKGGVESGESVKVTTLTVVTVYLIKGTCNVINANSR